MADSGRPEPRTANAVALGWLFTDQVLVTAGLAAVKWLDGTYPSIQLVFLRSLIGVAVMAPWVLRRFPSTLRTGRPVLHLLRVLLSATALTATFYAVARLPLADAMAIGYTRPLLMTVLAALILAERIDGRRWGFTVAGLVGLAVIVGPKLGEGTPGTVDAYAAAVLAAVAGTGAIIVQKILSRTEGEPVLMAYYVIAIAVVSGIPSAAVWQPVQAADWPVILVVGLSALAGQYCFLRAYRLGEASFLAPFGYFHLVFGVAAGWMLFSEWPDAWTVSGAAIIVAASLMLGRPRARS